MTIKKVIIVVLMMMFLIPLFDTDVYLDPGNSFDFTLANVNGLLTRNDTITLSMIN